ncbi:MAG: transcription antitermination factor NusB [Candidatus Absconditabacterales bacterium]
MNITHRINARKIVLAYAYWLFFLQYYRTGTDLSTHVVAGAAAVLDEDDTAFLEGVGIDTNQIQEEEQEVLIDRKTFDNMGSFEDDVAMITDGLGIDVHLVDREYVLLIGEQLASYQSDVPHLVNTHANQFLYEDMESMKKAIFTLGYTEHKILGTDTKVIINEMVELAKRFSGTDTFKLVNSILHHVLIEDLQGGSQGAKTI